MTLCSERTAFRHGLWSSTAGESGSTWQRESEGVKASGGGGGPVNTIKARLGPGERGQRPPEAAQVSAGRGVGQKCGMMTK